MTVLTHVLPLALAGLLGLTLGAGPAGAQVRDVQDAPPIENSDPEPETPAVAPIPAEWSPVPRDADGRTAYGLYLAARSALAGGQGVEGAALMARAARLTPEQPIVRQQTFMSSLISGDLNVAAANAPTGDEAPPLLTEAGRFVGLIQTAASGDARGAWRDLQARPIAAPHAFAAGLVRPWLAAAAGDWPSALAPIQASDIGEIGLLQRFDRAQLLEIRGRDEEAEAEYRAVLSAMPAQNLFRSGLGAFLERQRRGEDAAAVYRDAPEPARAAFASALGRAEAGRRPPPVVTPAIGMATALTNAASVLSSQPGAAEFAAVYLRLALSVDPTDARRLQLAGQLQQARLNDAARAVYETIGRQDPVAFAAARTQIGQILSQDDRDDDALEQLRLAEAAVPGNPVLAQMLAGMLVQTERYDAALDILNGPLFAASESADIHFLRGAAYERMGQAERAEAELWAALQQRPDDPTILNYLGYLWVDSGRRVEQGAELIQRAVDAAPEDGNIRDSLGWAQFRQGLYPQAVETLERAVAQEPGNAEINDHLGDAYWRVGRRREAGFQWSRVLTLDPDAERRTQAERKLAEGLDAPGETDVR